jgi:hypothetical protein
MRPGRLLALGVLFFYLRGRPLLAEPGIGLRIDPEFVYPVADTVLRYGIGGRASVSYATAKTYDFFAQGGYTALFLDSSAVTSPALYDGGLGAGFRWSPNDRLALRAEAMAGLWGVSWPGYESIYGIVAGSRAEASYRLSPSFSMAAVAGFRSYLFMPQPFMNALTGSLSFNLDTSELRQDQMRAKIEYKSQEPIFPVFYSYYDEHAFGTVKVTNGENADMRDVKVSLYVPQYMRQPKLCATVAAVKPGAAIDVPAKAFFEESILSLTERVESEAFILVDYSVVGAKRQAKIPFRLGIDNRNSMSWVDDRRAAAFCSSKDPAALWFAKYASTVVKSRLRPLINKNVQYAMGVFEALNSYGLNYVIDPSSSYVDKAGDASAVDFLQYPFQTLMYRGGDCDDLSILNCSLLEAIGIDTAFITIPGHIYMAFSSGMSAQEVKDSSDPGLFIEQGGKFWIPVEITILKEGFNKAWRIGSKEWRDAQARGTANLYPMADSWKLYKPVSVPGAVSRFSLPDETAVAAGFEKSLTAFVSREIEDKIAQLKPQLSGTQKP